VLKAVSLVLFCSLCIFMAFLAEFGSQEIRACLRHMIDFGPWLFG
jgi:hypothetical protein